MLKILKPIRYDEWVFCWYKTEGFQNISVTREAYVLVQPHERKRTDEVNHPKYETNFLLSLLPKSVVVGVMS